jgi:hypothetical protein
MWSTYPERATERRSYRPAGWCHSVTVLATADAAPRTLPQAGHVAAHVVVLDGRVRVDADQPAAAGRGERDVQRARDPAVGVVVQLDPRIGGGQARHDGGGVVTGAAVDDHHDLQVAVVLDLDALQRGADEARLVAGRHDDRDQVGVGAGGDVRAGPRGLVGAGAVGWSPVRRGHGVRSPALVGRVGHVLHLLALGSGAGTACDRLRWAEAVRRTERTPGCPGTRRWRPYRARPGGRPPPRGATEWHLTCAFGRMPQCGRGLSGTFQDGWCNLDRG